MHSSTAYFITYAVFSAVWAEGLSVSHEHTMNLVNGVNGNVDGHVIDKDSAHIEKELGNDKIAHFVVQTEDGRIGGAVPEVYGLDTQRILKKSVSSKSVKKSKSPKSVQNSKSPKSVKNSNSPKSVKNSMSPKGKNQKKKKKTKVTSNNKSSIDITFKPIVHVVTHATEDGTDIFWSTWKEGAEAALGDTADLIWDAVGYNITHASEALERACASSDAIVVTVPYAEGTENFQKMDDLINQCIFQKQKPVFTTNTDTYHNDDVFAYFGSSNYDMGVKCALTILFPTDDAVISGRTALPGKNETDHSMDIQIYWDASSRLNEGLRQRFEGLVTTLEKYKEDDEVVTFIPTGLKSCPCVDRYPDGVPTDDNEGLRVTIDGKVYDYPPKYGLETCSRHDKNLDPTCSGSNPPAFCDEAWCYVDPENCDSVQPSTEGEYIWTDYAGQEYPYSYETCGSKNSYLDFISVGDSGDDLIDGTQTGNDKQTIVLSSNWAPRWYNAGNESSLFICGDETFSMPQVPQYGQSPWLQGVSSVSAAATAARVIANQAQWRAFKGNSAAASSSNSYNGPQNFGTFAICMRNRANNLPVEGATVQCWDNDIGYDDEIGVAGDTGADGCYLVHYSTASSWDYSFRVNPRYPDIYCIARYYGVTWTTNERTNHNGQFFSDTLVVDIPSPNEVTVCVESSSFNNEPVPGAHVECWDDDYGFDDPIGEKGMTGDDGCYTAFYNPDKVGDPYYVTGTEPDIYCIVNYLGQEWLTNKNEGLNRLQAQLTFSTMRVDTEFRSKIKEDLSRYGKAIINMFERFNVQVGDTWDVFWDAEFDEENWIIQHPPAKYVGGLSKDLPVPEMCDDGVNCDTEFGLKECTTNLDCNGKKICAGPGEKLYGCDSTNEGGYFFRNGVCESVSATRKDFSSVAKKLCVGHSDFLYDRMYEHIIQAQEFVDVTSLDSPNLLGYADSDGETKQFGAMLRNAISYLHSTGRRVTIKFMFGSIFNSNENPKQILDGLTRGVVLTNTNLNIWAGTYRTTAVSWNHGKIIAVDGKQVFAGGTNYYPEVYLQEDPVFDVNIMVSNGPAVGAHKYAEKLWTPLCEWTFAGAGLSHVEGAAVNKNGVVEYVTGQYITQGLWECPPAFQGAKNSYDGKTANGAMVIQAARLGLLASDEGDNLIEDGQKTSDLAMYAMMESAERSIYFSQQDLLPVILDGGASYLSGNGGFRTCWGVGCTGMTDTSFEDTWRKISGIAKAVSRQVEVSIMVSAPCAQGAGDPNAQTGSQFLCPVNGTQGDGYDYWDDVYRWNNGRWPSQRAMDQFYAHITEGMSPLGAGTDNRRLGYGYGWSLENIADWIFAYYAINKSARPTKTVGVTVTYKNAQEVADHICQFVKIAHVRLNRNEATYMRGNNPGGQVGNHAKILMVDEEIFYIGSDNAYGGGLAEFGFIIDDVTRTKDFADNYWKVLWTEAIGVNNSALVSGDPLNCKWRTDHFERFNWEFND